MRSLKKILSFIFITLISIIVLSGCNEKKEPLPSKEALEFSKIVEAGVYTNVLSDKNDSIKIIDNTVQFENFNIDELVEYYESTLNEIQLSEADFRDVLSKPYNINLIYKEDAKGSYSINVPLFGEDKENGYLLHYDSENKLIMFRKDTYKLQTENKKNESN